jgi:hypothetical protein
MNAIRERMRSYGKNQKAEYAEPSDWEIASRYIGWTLMAVMVFVIFIMGLQ